MAKAWLITGTSSGFGRELTELLLARGDSVAATLRSPGALHDLKSAHGDKLWLGHCDVTDTHVLRKVVDDAFSAIGRIDVVISNAGYGLFGAAEELDDEQIDRQIATNLTASIQFARAVIPHLRRQGGGRLFQISSKGGQITYPMLSLYHATKWGIEGFCEALAQEVASFGIKVTIVEPGGARTNFSGSSCDLATALEVYRETPVGEIRKRLSAGSANPIGDPRKVAQAIINCADEDLAPLRLVLGSDSYRSIKSTLTARLNNLRAQRDIAMLTDM